MLFMKLECQEVKKKNLQIKIFPNIYNSRYNKKIPNITFVVEIL